MLYPFELGRRFWGRGGRFVIFTAGGAQNSTQDGPDKFNWSQIRNSKSFYCYKRNCMVQTSSIGAKSGDPNGRFEDFSVFDGGEKRFGVIGANVASPETSWQTSPPINIPLIDIVRPD